MKVLYFLVLIFITQNSFGFTLRGQSFIEGFSADTVSVFYNPTNCPSTIASDINTAVEFLNSAPSTNLKLNVNGTTATGVSTFSGFAFAQNTILIGCSIDTNADAGGCDAACLNSLVGVGTSSFNGVQIFNGYVILNENNGVGGEYSTKSESTRTIVMAHELGHVLGLGHSAEPAALMHYSVAQKSNLNFHQDDIDGLNYLYPSNEPGDGLMGCGTISTNNKNNFNLVFLLLFLAPLLVLIYVKGIFFRFPKNQFVKI